MASISTSQETLHSTDVIQAHFDAADGSLQEKIIPGVVLLQRAMRVFPEKVYGVRQALYGAILGPESIVDYEIHSRSVTMKKYDTPKRANTFEFFTDPAHQVNDCEPMVLPSVMEHVPDDHAKTTLYGSAFDLAEHAKTKYASNFEYLSGVAVFPTEADYNEVDPALLPEAGAQVLVSAMRARFPNLVPALGSISDYSFPAQPIQTNSPITVSAKLTDPEIDPKKGGAIASQIIFEQNRKALATLNLGGVAMSQRAFKRFLRAN